MTQYDVSAKFQCKNASQTSSLEILPPCPASGGQMHHVTRCCIGFSTDSISISVSIIVLEYVWMGRGSRRPSKFFAQLLLRKSVKELLGVFRQPPQPIQTSSPPPRIYSINRHYRNKSKIHALQLPGTVSHWGGRNLTRPVSTDPNCQLRELNWGAWTVVCTLWWGFTPLSAGVRLLALLRTQ